jgi:hypothetical protein
LGTSWGNTSRRENVGKTFGKQIGDMVGTPKCKKLDPSHFSPPKGKKWALGTYREQIGDMVGTPKSQKIDPSPSAPFSPPKEKNMDPPGCMLNHLIGCMKILFLKLFVTIFDLG